MLVTCDFSPSTSTSAKQTPPPPSFHKGWVKLKFPRNCLYRATKWVKQILNVGFGSHCFSRPRALISWKVWSLPLLFLHSQKLPTMMNSSCRRGYYFLIASRSVLSNNLFWVGLIVSYSYQEFHPRQNFTSSISQKKKKNRVIDIILLDSIPTMLHQGLSPSKFHIYPPNITIEEYNVPC